MRQSRRARCEDAERAFRQGHDFFYMTGVEIPDAILVVDGQRKESVLFFTMTETVADGFTSPVELIRAPVAYTGIERALPADQFSSFLSTRQKELYEAALAVHNVAIENYRPVTKRKSRGR